MFSRSLMLLAKQFRAEVTQHIQRQDCMNEICSDNEIRDHVEEIKLTKTSAITRGWRKGFRMNTNKRVAITTKVNCKMKRGRE